MKKTKFDKNVQILTYKPNTCLNSGEWETSSVLKKEDVYLRRHFTPTESHEANITVESPSKWTSTTPVVETSESIELNDTDLELNAVGYTFSKIF